MWRDRFRKGKGDGYSDSYRSEKTEACFFGLLHTHISKLAWTLKPVCERSKKALHCQHEQLSNLAKVEKSTLISVNTLQGRSIYKYSNIFKKETAI